MLARLAASRRLRSLVLAIAVVALAILAIRVAVRPSSDLLNHREFGRRFVAGTYLYAGGLNYPYLPTWAAAHAPLSLLPASVVTLVVLVGGIAALLTLLWLLERLTRIGLSVEPTMAWIIGAATLVLTARFVIRDLLDGGENLILTTFAWAALFAWTRARLWTGAWLLGAAIALKLTATVFLVVLVARRHYARAVAASLCAGMLIALPAVRMGIESYGVHLQRWSNGVRAGLSSTDPTIGVLGAEPTRNLALRPAIGRWLIGERSSASWRQTANWLAAAAVATLTAVLFFSARRLPPADVGETVAWAAAGVVGLLISPITWRAHAVAILPAMYLLIRRWVAEGRLFSAGTVALAALAVSGVILARGVVGEGVSDWSDAWSLTTLALLVLAGGMTRWPIRH